MVLDFIDTNFIIALVVAVMTGATSGLLGTFMVLKRMSLVGDALSHVALPGIALALILDFNPFLGAFAILALAVIVIWILEEKTEIPVDALVGVLFTAALAVGIIIFPEHDLLEALFGDIATINVNDGMMALAFLVLAIVALKLISKPLLLDIISKDLSKITEKRRALNELIFLALVALVVALGLKILGTLLMGALVIVPAAAGKNIGRGFSQYLVFSVFAGAFSGAAGILLSRIYEIPPGPAVIGVAAVIFLISLIFRRK
jgi:ABC-type Mn2+/Zn2+ transport system permease subunit